jgi:hypothetical protein
LNVFVIYFLLISMPFASKKNPRGLEQATFGSDPLIQVFVLNISFRIHTMLIYYKWGISHKIWNRLMHSINGNMQSYIPFTPRIEVNKALSFFFKNKDPNKAIDIYNKVLMDINRKNYFNSSLCKSKGYASCRADYMKLLTHIYLCQKIGVAQRSPNIMIPYKLSNEVHHMIMESRSMCMFPVGKTLGFPVVSKEKISVKTKGSIVVENHLGNMVHVIKNVRMSNHLKAMMGYVNERKKLWDRLDLSVLNFDKDLLEIDQRKKSINHSLYKRRLEIESKLYDSRANIKKLMNSNDYKTIVFLNSEIDNLIAKDSALRVFRNLNRYLSFKDESKVLKIKDYPQFNYLDILQTINDVLEIDIEYAYSLTEKKYPFINFLQTFWMYYINKVLNTNITYSRLFYVSKRYKKLCKELLSIKVGSNFFHGIKDLSGLKHKIIKRSKHPLWSICPDDLETFEVNLPAPLYSINRLSPLYRIQKILKKPQVTMAQAMIIQEFRYESESNDSLLEMYNYYSEKPKKFKLCIVYLMLLMNGKLPKIFTMRVKKEYVANYIINGLNNSELDLLEELFETFPASNIILNLDMEKIIEKGVATREELVEGLKTSILEKVGKVKFKTEGIFSCGQKLSSERITCDILKRTKDNGVKMFKSYVEFKEKVPRHPSTMLKPFKYRNVRDSIVINVDDLDNIHIDPIDEELGYEGLVKDFDWHFRVVVIDGVEYREHEKFKGGKVRIKGTRSNMLTVLDVPESVKDKIRISKNSKQFYDLINEIQQLQIAGSKGDQNAIIKYKLKESLLREMIRRLN